MIVLLISAEEGLLESICYGNKIFDKKEENSKILLYQIFRLKNAFQANVSYLYPPKTTTRGFLMHLGGIKMNHWLEVS